MGGIVVALAFVVAGAGAWLIGPGSSDTDEPAVLAGAVLVAAAVPWTASGLALLAHDRRRRELAAATRGRRTDTATPLAGAVPPADGAASGVDASGVEAAAPGPLPPPAPPALSEAPPRHAHVVDGIHRPLRRGRIAVVGLLGAALLGGGVWLWSGEQVLAGVTAACVGTLLLSFLASTIVVGRREGAIWHAEPGTTWPQQRGTAEVIGVWHEGRLASMDVCVLDLRVHVEGVSWEVRLRQEVPSRWVSAVAPRSQLAVRADPTDQHRVAVDWPASDHPRDPI
ncbi:MAG: hypothetical protein JJU45_01005 [Acidimicrobiia bacterium]|nr:hypothetical protein [Acidimicrobiia bacterium]